MRTMDVIVATKTNAICSFATLFAVLRFPFLLHSLWFRDDARDDYDGDEVTTMATTKSSAAAASPPPAAAAAAILLVSQVGL